MSVATGVRELGAAPSSALGRIRRASAGPAIVLAVASVPGGGALLRLSPPAGDDAYIVARYVRQIVAGNGWTMNVGQVWNAATSPLHVVLATVVAAVGIEPIDAVRLVPAAALVLGLGLLAIALWNDDQRAAAACVVPAVLLLARLRAAAGLETQLLVGLLLLALACEIFGRTRWPLAGLAVLTRPDGALLAAWLLGVEAARQRRPPWRPLAALTVVVVPWLAYSTWRFGSLLPDSVSNKAAQARSGLFVPYGSLGTTLDWFDRAYGPGVWSLVLVLAAIGTATALRRWGAGAIGPVVTVVGQHAVYSIAGAPAYDWYYVPLVTVLAVYAALGLVALPTLVRPRLARPLSVALGCMLVASFAASPTGRANRTARLEAYEGAAATVSGLGAGSVAISEVGIVGYGVGADVAVFDLVGLVSPNPPVFSKGGVDRFFDVLPEAVILHDVEPSTPAVEAWPMEMPVVDDARFAQHYEEATRLVYASPGGLVVYTRRGG